LQSSGYPLFDSVLQSHALAASDNDDCQGSFAQKADILYVYPQKVEDRWLLFKMFRSIGLHSIDHPSAS
jgi:hypothetical protein